VYLTSLFCAGLAIAFKLKCVYVLYISYLNSIWWDKHIRKDTKKYIGKVLVESVLLYGSEIWTLNEYYRKRSQTVEMDYLRRSARVSRLEHISNQEIRTRMNAEKSIIELRTKASVGLVMY
jgi:hypothetical protein